VTTQQFISALTAIQAAGEPDSLALMIHPRDGQAAAIVDALSTLLGPGAPGRSRDGSVRWMEWGDRLTVFLELEVTT